MSTIDDEAARQLLTIAPPKGVSLAWTEEEARVYTEEEARAYDGLLYGVEQEAAYWDEVNREACAPCEVCELVFHSRDLEPCGPCESVCPACAEEYNR